MSSEQSARFMHYRKDKFQIFIDPLSKRRPSSGVFVEAPSRISAHILMSGFIGAYSYIRDGSRLGGGVRSIGRYCSIAPGVILGDGQHHIDWLTTHPFADAPEYKVGQEQPSPNRSARKMTVIGNDVWIGANAIVMRGIVVGDGAVIGAGAVITKDVPSYAIVVGIPGKILRYRFPRETVQRLLKLRWWQYTSRSLMGVPFHDVHAAIVEIERRKQQGTLRMIDHPILRLGKEHEAWWVIKEENIRKVQRTYKGNCATTRIILPEIDKPPKSTGQKLLKKIKRIFKWRKIG